MTSNHHELSWGSMPSDITQEICTALLHQRVYAPAAAENVRSFLAVNKQMRFYKDRITKNLLPLLCASTRLHPLLAPACLMTRADWMSHQSEKIATGEQIQIKTQKNSSLVDSHQMCNKADATLAGLIDHAHKIALLCPSARYKALHSYLKTKYDGWNDSAGVIIRDDGTPLVVPAKILPGKNCAVDNVPVVFFYDETNKSYDLNFCFYDDDSSSGMFLKCGYQSNDKLKDIQGYQQHILLFTKDTQGSSFIVECSDDPMEICDTLCYWMSKNRIKDFFNYTPPSKKTVSFEGIATKLAYDDATQEIVAFDDKGERLFCQKIDQLQYDAEPPTDE